MSVSLYTSPLLYHATTDTTIAIHHYEHNNNYELLVFSAMAAALSSILVNITSQDESDLWIDGLQYCDVYLQAQWRRDTREVIEGVQGEGESIETQISLVSSKYTVICKF